MTDERLKDILKDYSKGGLIDLMEELNIRYGVSRDGSASRAVIADAMVVAHRSILIEHFRDNSITEVLSFTGN